MKVLVSHPHRLFSESLTRALLTADGIDAVDACSAEDLPNTVDSYQPEVLVISGQTFSTFKDEIIEKTSGRRIGYLVISSSPDPEEFATVLKAGATGYIGIDCSWKQLTETISKVAAGEVVVTGLDRQAPSVDGDKPHIPSVSDQKVMNSLTPREREVLNLLSRGLSNRQIANDLFLSEHTVRTHVQNLRGKLNVRSKFQAAMLAMQVGGTSERSAGKELLGYRF